jgi:hypothetical protein
MVPCKKFKWCNDEYLILKTFKHHFLNCKKCDKTNNNNNFFANFNNYKIHYQVLTIEDKINELLNKYHTCEKIIFEYTGDDKNYEHMYIYKINLYDNIYNNTFLIVY